MFSVITGILRGSGDTLMAAGWHLCDQWPTHLPGFGVVQTRFKPCLPRLVRVTLTTEMDALLERRALQLRERLGPQPWLKWIKASVGNTVRLIPVEQVLYLKSDTKYTLVVWEGGEALIRKTIRELADILDPQFFAQIHRSVIVNLQQVAHYANGQEDSGEVQLKGCKETLSVSRSYVHLFRQM